MGVRISKNHNIAIMGKVSEFFEIRYDNELKANAKQFRLTVYYSVLEQVDRAASRYLFLSTGRNFYETNLTGIDRIATAFLSRSMIACRLEHLKRVRTLPAPLFHRVFFSKGHKL